MLIINECRTCNADNTTCPVKQELRDKLQNAGIKERIKYKCSDWQKHLKYKIGDKISFRFVENGHFRGELSEETLAGTIIDISKKRPIYMVVIDKANRNLIDKEFTAYDRFVTPYAEDGVYISEEEAQYFTVPVKESLIVENHD